MPNKPNNHGSLDPHYTIEQVLEEPLKVRIIADAANRKKTVKELLDRVALPAEFATRYPKELS